MASLGCDIRSVCTSGGTGGNPGKEEAGTVSVGAYSVTCLSLSFPGLLFSPAGLIIPSLLEKLLLAKIKIHLHSLGST